MRIIFADQSRVDHDARDMLQRMMSMDAGAGTSSSSMRVAMAMGAQSVPSGAAGAAAWRLRLLQSATVRCSRCTSWHAEVRACELFVPCSRRRHSCSQ